MEKYIEKIKASEIYDEIEQIIEDAAMDDDLTNEEYCAIYNFGIDKVKGWKA